MQCMSVNLRDPSGRVVENAICITHESDIDALDISCLSASERKRYSAIKHPDAKKNFLLGRYSAKKAFCALSKTDSEMKNVDVVNGIFGNPILSSSKYDVSISHTKAGSECVGAAIVFDRIFSFGIDVESIKPEKIEILRKVSPEIVQDNIEKLTAAWCVKEALSKALRIGFTIPFEALKIEKMDEFNNKFMCQFSNFRQYIGYTKKEHCIVAALTYPKYLLCQA